MPGNADVPTRRIPDRAVFVQAQPDQLRAVEIRALAQEWEKLVVSEA